jgi:pyrroline-5-carboxylate reductase
MSDYQLGVIGGGNMATAMLRGVLGSKLLAPGQIIVSEPDAQRRSDLSNLGLATTDDNRQAAACRRVLLAVKPQVMAEVLQNVAPDVRPEALVISIAAGLTTGWLDAALGGRGRVVRVMPNTPMLVGEGMSAVAPGPRAGEDEVAWTLRLCRTAGRAIQVDERSMDAVTAVSGSGPAYVFYLAEAMVAAGLAEGLDEATAQALAAQTCLGAGKLLRDSSESPQQLRRKVTSPGGTTERAIETMDAACVNDALVRSIRAAAQRSRELAG